MNRLTPRDPFVSPRFGQVATFMRLPISPSPVGLDVALLGIPFDGGVTYRPGARFGPRAVRGTPFRRGVEEGLIDPIEVIRIEEVKERGTAWVAGRLARLRTGPLYCSFDIDEVDPAYAPATGVPEVGGLTSYEAVSLVRTLAEFPLVGADGVEVSPPYDGPGQITALLAANLLFEMVSVIARGR
jgi:arginase family enzyme